MEKKALAELKAVECMPGDVRPGHGLKLVLTFDKLKGAISEVQLDLCGDVYAAMPPGTATAANWMLPLKVYGSFLLHDADNASAPRARRRHVNGEVDSGPGPESHYSFVLGARKLSHQTLRKRLEDLKTAGDPPFVIDLMCIYNQKPRLLCRVATRASSIQSALDSPGHALQVVDPIPAALLAQADARRSPSSVRVSLLLLRWWLLPLLFTALCIGLLLAPTEVSQKMSPLIPRIIRLHKPVVVRSIAAVLPPVPASLSQAFQLGELSVRYFAHSPRNITILAEAAALLARTQPLSEEELGGVLARVQQLEQHVGLVTRVRGFFTFVNTMWLIAIIGIAISIGPSLRVILRPVRDLLERLAKKLFHHVVKPVVRFMHDRGILEIVAWLVCGGIMLEAQEHVTEEIALFVASTSMALACPALAYSTFRHAGKLKGGDPNALPRMVSAWFAFTTASLAMIHDSKLLGYFSIVSAYAAIGFHVAAYGLCYVIGFENDTAMERCAVTSFLLLSGMGGARFLNASQGMGMHLAPFQSAISVFGCIVLFLALLIMSSRFYCRSQFRDQHRFRSYRFANLVTLMVLLGFMALGSVGGLPGMANTATVFMVLWLVEKYADFHCECAWSGWVLVLMLSVVTWRGALWLHSKPEFVASLFDF